MVSVPLQVVGESNSYGDLDCQKEEDLMPSKFVLKSRNTQKVPQEVSFKPNERINAYSSQKRDDFSAEMGTILSEHNEATRLLG